MHDQIPIPALTAQERKILAHLVDGLSNREIAERLFVSPSTVKWHIRQLNNKLVTNNRVEIVERATAMGLIERLGDVPQRGTDNVLTHNLPNDLTPFIGREAELEQLETILKGDSIRLLTIAGLGGIGKSRLALTLARRVASRYPDGVYFVGLASKTTLDGLASAVLSELEAKAPSSTSPSDHLLTVFGEQQCLLILDNFEHLIEVSPYLLKLLQHATSLVIIVTSRVRLNLNAETTFNLRGLPFGDESTAEQLLVERIQTYNAQPMDATNVHVKRICQLTEGSPLALVLAASWSDVLSLSELADEIEQGIDILTSDHNDVPPRQRSIRATLDYSWKHLVDNDQQAAAQLSVFVNGFQREAAQAIANVNLPILKSLVRRSVLTLENGRYHMHELVRQYAADVLQQNTKLYHATQASFSDYFANYVVAANKTVMSDEGTSYASIMAEHNNILAAWDGIILNGEYDTVSEIIQAMSMAYENQLTWHDSYWLATRTIQLLEPLVRNDSYADLVKMIAALNWMSWTTALLGRPEETLHYSHLHNELTNKLIEAGFTNTRSEDLPIAVSYAHSQVGNYQEAIAEAKTGLQRSLKSATLRSRGNVMIANAKLCELYLLTGDLASAEHYINLSWSVVADMEGTWAQWWICRIALLRGHLAYLQGDLDEMGRNFQKLKTCAAAAQDLNAHGRLAYFKSQAALDAQDYGAAAHHIEDCVAYYQRNGYRPVLYTALAQSAYIQIASGSLAQGRDILLDALEYEDNNLRVTADIMLSMAFLLLASGLQLNLAHGLLFWVTTQPATEFLTRRRAQNLLDAYQDRLSQIKLTPTADDDLMQFRQDTVSVLRTLSLNTVT